MRHETFADGRLVEAVDDNGDGTGVRTVYDPDGDVVATEPVTGLALPDPPDPLAAKVAELDAALDALLGGNDE